MSRHDLPRISILILLLQFCNVLFAQEQLLPVYHFRRLTAADGSYPLGIRAPVVRDNGGFIWIGTVDGLLRYDGYSFKTYENNPADPYSISSNAIKSLLVDSMQRLWIGTSASGLSLYDIVHDRFINFIPHQGDSSWYESKYIAPIIEDRSGNLWLGAFPGGVVQVKVPKGEKYKNLDSLVSDIHFKNYDLGTPLNAVSDLIELEDGKILVASDSGLMILDPSNHSLSRRFLNDLQKHPLDSIVIACFLRDSHKNLWVGTATEGMFYIDMHTKQILHYRHREGDHQSLKSDDIWDIVEAWNGDLWISTSEGICLFSPKSGKCILYLLLNPMLCSSSLLSIDNSGTIWISTLEDGVYYLNPISQLFPHYSYRTPEGKPQSFETIEYNQDGSFWLSTGEKIVQIDLSTQKVLKKIDVYPGQNPPMTFPDDNSTLIDRHGNFWYGTMGLGLYKINLVMGLVDNYRFDYRLGKQCWAQRIIECKADSYWVASYMNGLMKFDTASGKFISVLGFSELGMILNIMKDQLGKIWIASEQKGIFIYDPLTGSRSHFIHNSVDPRSLSSDVTCKVYQDSSGRIWIGAGNVLNLWEPETRSFTRFTNPEFAYSQWIVPLGCDVKDRLWVTSYEGKLAVLDPVTGIFTNYDISHGLCGGVFDMKNLADGRILITGWSGINIFHPDSLNNFRSAPPLTITRLSINDKATAPPELSQGLKLSYTQNVLELEFAAIDIDAPDLVHYQYRLEGLENDWIRSQKRRYVRYPSLAPGNYTFRVKAISIRNEWPEQEIALAIIIAPPWYRTTWAYFSYLLIFIGLLITSYQLRLKQFRLKQQLEMEHFQATHLAEVDRLKSRFFANISHEFRTPLTLILGPIEKLKSLTTSKEAHHTLGMMKRNAHQLLRLINQLLDLSKLEAGAMKLQVRRGNIVPVIKGVAYSFESSAGLRKIELNVDIEQDEIQMYFDRDKVEKIVTNLLANAFKFTPDGGRVGVVVTCNIGMVDRRGAVNRAPTTDIQSSVTITITDTGVGIPADKLSHIFDRFYQVDDSSTRRQGGTGIGLALVKELVEMHHGTISVDSKPGVGTEFTIILPGDRTSYNSEEIIEGKLEEEEPISMLEEEIVEPTTIPPGSETISEKKSDKPIILVVEDNADVRQYIRENLPSSYQVIEASDGSIGIEKAREIIPDLIISDVMMPKADGYELCRILKNDERTSHIPIILLTAKAASENKIEGLQTGADDYLIKPFEPKELVARVDNLIEQRRQLRKKFSVGVMLKPGEMAVTSLDDALMKRIIKIVENRMSNEDFSVDQLAQDVFLSRRHLERKLLALTNLSPTEFIRHMRLQRAYQLLEKKTGSVADIAFQVGFSSSSYFSSCFREYFGFPPSELPRPKN